MDTDQRLPESQIADGPVRRRTGGVYRPGPCRRRRSLTSKRGTGGRGPFVRSGEGQGVRSRYDIKADRAYGSFQELMDKEKALPADKRIDFVTVATPNHTHFPIAKAAVEAGFNVICDKPMTFDLKEAEELQKLVEKSGVVFAVSHNYTGYPLVRQVREMVRNETWERSTRSGRTTSRGGCGRGSSRRTRSRRSGGPIPSSPGRPGRSAISGRTPTTWLGT